MQYSPDSKVTLTGSEMNDLIAQFTQLKSNDNKQKELIEDQYELITALKATKKQLTQKVEDANWEYKKTLATNKLLLRHYASSRLTKLELDSANAQASICQSNARSYLDQIQSLQAELKLALEAIPEKLESYV